MIGYPKRVDAPHDSVLAAALSALPDRAGLRRDFPPEVEAEADAAAARPVLPDADATHIPLVTIDPPGATDLDQALAIEPDGDGWIVHYAIADLPSFVVPGGAVDREARRRGTTVYLPDGRLPLHPPVLSEGAASLLPDQPRSAFLWRIRLDAAGDVTTAVVSRARVRSRAQLSYQDAQDSLGGTDGFGLRSLRAVGELRLARERDRGGASLNSPEAIVEPDDGGYRLRWRRVLPVERWNAQISLLTGMSAARIMLDARIGILRTMPPADPERLVRFRRQAAELGRPWTEGSYGGYLAGLDGSDPAHLAIMHSAAALFRGAAYTAFDGEVPVAPEQAAIAAPYAHVTAPLRRLVDRWGLEICAALCAGEDVPAWVRQSLPELPGLMAETSARAARLDREATDIVEAAALSGRVGELFDVAVVADNRVLVLSPAVEAACDCTDDVGTRIRAELVEADIASGRLRFSTRGRSTATEDQPSSESSPSSRGVT